MSVHGTYLRNCDVKYIHCTFCGGPGEDRREQTVQVGGDAVLCSGEADTPELLLWSGDSEWQAWQARGGACNRMGCITTGIGIACLLLAVYWLWVDLAWPHGLKVALRQAWCKGWEKRQAHLSTTNSAVCQLLQPNKPAGICWDLQSLLGCGNLC